MARITGLICLLLLMPVLCFAQPKNCLSSGTKAVAGGNTAIAAAAAKLCGVIIQTDGTNDATVEVWDNASAASGTCLFNMTVTGGDNRGGAVFPYPISAMNGLYLDFNTCTGCSVEVYYQP
jgi:hypothetical protein